MHMLYLCVLDLLGIRCHYHCIVFNDSITNKTDHYVQQYENSIIQVQYICLLSIIVCNVNAKIVVKTDHYVQQYENSISQVQCVCFLSIIVCNV